MNGAHPRCWRSAPTAAIAIACMSLLTLPAQADDWPQWRGPQRDGILRETGLVDAIPEEGLPVLWRTPIAGGYAGPAVANGRVYVTDYVRESGDASNAPGRRAELQGTERVLCLSVEDGSILWTHEYDCPYKISYPCGPRVTPTVDGDRVYTVGAEGHLFCLNAESGDVLWSRQLRDEYKVDVPIWGFSGHPLVDGDKLICLVGGEGSVAVAFNKHTGEELWRALTASEPGYCPPTMIELGETRQLLIWDADAINSLDPETGNVLWSQPLKPNYGMSIMAPQLYENKLFASGIGNVGAMFELGVEQPSARMVWKGTSKSAVYCANSTPLIVDGTIYGVDCRTGGLRAVRLDDGAVLWETFAPTTGDRRAGHGTAFIVKNADRYFLFNEQGDLVLAELSPTTYQELGRFHVLEPTGEAFGRSVVWSHPAFANGSLFARNDSELVCVSLKKTDVEK